jgi:hypothetical protein
VRSIFGSFIVKYLGKKLTSVQIIFFLSNTCIDWNNARNSLNGFYTTTGTRRLEHYVFIPIPIQPSAHIWFLLNPDANHMKFIPVHKIKLKDQIIYCFFLVVFSGDSGFSLNKTDRHDIAEILLNTITLPPIFYYSWELV